MLSVFTEGAFEAEANGVVEVNGACGPCRASCEMPDLASIDTVVETSAALFATGADRLAADADNCAAKLAAANSWPCNCCSKLGSVASCVGCEVSALSVEAKALDAFCAADVDAPA